MTIQTSKVYSFKFQDRLREIIATYSAASGTSVTELLNKAVEDYIERNKEEIKKKITSSTKKTLVELVG